MNITEFIDVMRLRDATPISISDFKKVVDGLPDPFEYYQKNGPTPCRSRVIDKIERAVNHDLLHMATGIESVKKVYYRELSFIPYPPDRGSREWSWKPTQLLLIE